MPILCVPKLHAAGWDNEPHSIAEQRSFTDGRLVVHGNKAVRRKGKRADSILRYTRDLPIAVVEAKPDESPVFNRSGPTREVWYYEQPLPEGRRN